MDWCLFHREQNAVERLEIDKKNSEKTGGWGIRKQIQGEKKA